MLELRFVQVLHGRGIFGGLGFPVHQKLGFMLGIEIVPKKGLRKCVLPSLWPYFNISEKHKAVERMMQVLTGSEFLRVSFSVCFSL